MPRSIFEEMKYLEIMIVSDHSMVCVYMYVLTESHSNKKGLLSLYCVQLVRKLINISDRLPEG